MNLPRRIAFRTALLAAALGLAPARADTVFHFEGWVQRADSGLKECGAYVLLRDPLDRPLAVLTDPDGMLLKDLPARLELKMILLQPRAPGDLPVFRFVEHRPGSGASSPGPEPSWTAATELHFRA